MWQQFITHINTDLLTVGLLRKNFSKILNKTPSFCFKEVHQKILSAKWWPFCAGHVLTHWGRVTHICVSKLISIGSDNGLSPGRNQAIIWTNAGILLNGPLRTNFSEILISVYQFSLKHLKMSSGKCRPSCLSLNVLKPYWCLPHIHQTTNPVDTSTEDSHVRPYSYGN